jgi:AAA domain
MGLPFLGREVRQGKALYFSTQERPGPIAGHFKDLGCTAGTAPMVVVGQRFDIHAALDRLDATVREHPEIKLIVLDMVSDVLPLKDSNDYTEMNKKFAPLRELAETNKLHICSTTHTKKAHTENPVHSFIGSSAIAGAVDQLISMSTDQRQQRCLTTVQRYGESIPPTLLNWDSTRRAMHLGQSTEAAKAEQQKGTEDRIIRDLMLWVLGNPGRPREEILDAVKGDTTTKRKAFNQIKESGHFLQSGSGQRGEPYTYCMYKTSDETAVQAA